jgi:hypothetical protein
MRVRNHKMRPMPPKNSHQVGEETHRPSESESSKPTQHLLRAMREEDDAQREP